MFSIIASPLQAEQTQTALLVLFYFFIFFFIFVCYRDNSWKAQQVLKKISYMTFDQNSLGKFKDGHHRSHVTPALIGVLLPPTPWRLTYLRFQPIQTKSSHMIFDWKSSGEFKNGHHRSNVTPLMGVFSPPPPPITQIPPILMKFNHR